jgi:nitroreductase / dihydropteridine reductase
MTSFLSQLNWRNATKKFDGAQTMTPTHLENVLEAIRMAPTSFGLQPFQVIVVRETQLKEKLKASGWNQAQFTTADAVLVFVADLQVMERIERMLTLRTGGNPQARAQMADYENMMKGFAQNLSAEGLREWAQKQCYLALGFGLAACAELGLDSCPMEGFVPADFDKILRNPPHLKSTVVLTVGKAAADVPSFPKFRFPKNEMVSLR